MNKDVLKTLYKNLAPLTDDAARVAGKTNIALPFVGTNPSGRRAVQDTLVSTVHNIFDEPLTGLTDVKIDDKWFRHPYLVSPVDYTKFLHDPESPLNSDLRNLYLEPKEVYKLYTGGPQAEKNRRTKARILDKMVQGERTYDAPRYPSDPDKLPGRNTALGRWFYAQHPEIKYKYPIGPSPLDPLDPFDIDDGPDYMLPF